MTTFLATTGAPFHAISPVIGIEILIRIALEIDHAMRAEVFERVSRLRVEADELIADRDVEDALVTLAVGPVADAAPRESSRRCRRRACPPRGGASTATRPWRR